MVIYYNTETILYKPPICLCVLNKKFFWGFFVFVVYLLYNIVSNTTI